MREFIFKERNNILGIGARVIHFDETVDERCTFCRILYPPTETREEFIHLFRYCPIVKTYLQYLIRRLRINITYADPDPELVPDPGEIFNEIYWYGTHLNKTDASTVLFFELFRFIIWKFKTRRILPRPHEVHDVFLNMLDVILLCNKKIKNAFTKNVLLSQVLQALG